MELNAIIVDDEEQARKSLFFLLKTHFPNLKVKGIASSVAEAKTLLKGNEINVVFLDIEMPVEDGFCLLPHLLHSNASVVFTTAFSHFALRAIKASALDFLVKPFDVGDLQGAINKVCDSMKIHQTISELQSAISLNTLNDNLSDPRRIVKINLPNANGFRVVYVVDLLFIKADSNYCVFHLRDGETILVSKHLKEYDNMLKYSGFYRIHKSTLVNLSHLKDYTRKKFPEVTMANDAHHVIARRKCAGFVAAVKKLFPR